MTLSPIRAIVADDHPLWRRGVCDLLRGEPDIEVVAEASDGKAALGYIQTCPADIVLIDMEMPEMTGVEVTRAVREAGLDIRILALSAYDEPEYVSGLMAAGAAGYITKDKSPAVLLEAVRAVAAGEGRWFVRAPQMAAPDHGLSAREQEVLGHLAQGKTNREIGDALFISENTVRNHLTSLYAKVGAQSAREAVVWAWRNGFGVAG